MHDMKGRVFSSGERPIGDEGFCFDCHPGVPCFGDCCKGVDMYLYPYDVIRMKRNRGMHSHTFLARHTYSAFRDNPFFPSVMLKTEDGADRPCPFLVPEGCRIYEDRPSSCRTYPLERGVTRAGGAGHREDFYFLKRASHCRGHEEDRGWKVSEWLADQQIEPYNRMNDLWVDMDSLFRRNPWGDGEEGAKKLRMAFIACFDVDKFRELVFHSSFLSRFDLPKERIEKMETEDEEMMVFGFDWVRFFLTGKSPFS